MIAATSISSKSHNGYLAAEAGLVWKCSNSFLIIMHLGEMWYSTSFQSASATKCFNKRHTHGLIPSLYFSFVLCGGGLGMRLRHSICTHTHQHQQKHPNLLVTISSQTLIGSNLGWGKRERQFVRRVSTALVVSKLANVWVWEWVCVWVCGCVGGEEY